MSQTSLTVNEGTQTKLATDTVGGTEYGIVKLDMGTVGGTAPFTGTLLGINNIGTLPNLPGGSIVMTVGTISSMPNIPGGTINAGTVQISGGTVSVNELSGTVNLGTITGNIGMSSGTLNVGTVVIPSGTITTGSLSNIAMINAGTLGTITNVGQVYNAGTLQGGSIIVTLGTITGNKGVNLDGLQIMGMNQVGGLFGSTNFNPVTISGTNSTGTTRVPLVDDSGVQRSSGSQVITAGTLTTGSLSNVAMVNAGTVVIPSGTITTGSLSNVAMINAGTVVTSSGTIINSGTTTGVGVVSVLSKGTISLGSVGGIDANAAAQTGQPVAIGGTDSGGTVRTVLVNSAGAMSVSGASSGTFVNLSTGTLNVGTATVSGKDANAAAQTANPIGIGGTDSGGTIRTVNVDSTGALKVVGASAGTFVNISTGTLNTIIAGTLGTLSNLGSVTNVGMVNAGTVSMINAGTITSVGTLPGVGVLSVLSKGTISLGSVGGIDANAAAQTGNPIAFGGTDSGGTIRTVLVDSTGALKTTATLSSGTTVTVDHGSMVVTTGTINAGTINTGTINSGTINTGTLTISSGTFNSLGTVGTIQAGSIVVTAGTMSAGTINIGTVSLGTLKDNYGALGTMTITLASLANSGSVGRQSTIIDNTANLYSSANVFVKSTIGSVASTANSPIYIYLYRSDNDTPIIDDNWGVTDAGATVHNAPLLGIINVDTAGTNLQYAKSFDTSIWGPLGPKWGIGVVNNSGGSLHPTAGSHLVTYVGIRKQS